MDSIVETALPSLGSHSQPTIGLALGAGGARGFAHVPVLEVFDELGLKPSIIAGSSMGALIGAAYAAGMSGRDIRDYALHLADNRIGSALPSDPWQYAWVESPVDRGSLIASAPPLWPSGLVAPSAGNPDAFCRPWHSPEGDGDGLLRPVRADLRPWRSL